MKLLRAAYAKFATSPETAVRELEALANEGSLMSMVYIADAYQKGKGVTKDLSEYESWLEKAMKAGSSYAGYMLGRLHLRNRNYIRAKEVITVSASMNFLPSIVLLGQMYQKGNGVAVDYQKARQLFEESYTQGHLYSTKFLAKILLSGKFGLIQWLRGSILCLTWPVLLFRTALRKSNDQEKDPLRFMDQQLH